MAINGIRCQQNALFIQWKSSDLRDRSNGPSDYRRSTGLSPLNHAAIKLQQTLVMLTHQHYTEKGLTSQVWC